MTLPVALNTARAGRAASDGAKERAFVGAEGGQDALGFGAAHPAELNRRGVFRLGLVFVGQRPVGLLLLVLAAVLIRLICLLRLGLMFFLPIRFGRVIVAGLILLTLLVILLLRILLFRFAVALLIILRVLLLIARLAFVTLITLLFVPPLLLLPDALQKRLQLCVIRVDGEPGLRRLLRRCHISVDVQPSRGVVPIGRRLR